MDSIPGILSRRAWRRAVLARDRHQCRWCGSMADLCAHHVRELSRWPALALDLGNGLCLCWHCHFYEAHHGHPHFVHGRYAVTRRPLPGQLELFARWPGPLFAFPLAIGHSPLPAGSLWPGPQKFLFPALLR